MDDSQRLNNQIKPVVAALNHNTAATREPRIDSMGLPYTF